MRRYTVFTLALILVNSTCVFADSVDDYDPNLMLWTAGHLPSEFSPSPLETCKRFYANSLDPAAPNSGNMNSYSDVRVSRIDALWYYCGATEVWGSGPPFERYNTYKVLLIHRSCKPVNDVSYYADPDTGVCVPMAQGGTHKGIPQDPVCPLAGNPINFVTGNKVERFVDVQPLGSVAPAFYRTYNSADGVWRHSFSHHVRIVGWQANVVLEDGREVQFSADGDVYTALGSPSGVLTKTAEGYSYLDVDNTTYTFAADGELSGISSPSGYRIAIVREGSNVKVMVGNTLVYTFVEDAARQPLSLHAEGVDVSYLYDGALLLSVNSVRNGKSSSVSYQYSPVGTRHLLSGITDERGVVFAKWTYDDVGRAISSEHAGGAEKVTIQYQPYGTGSTVTNALGKSTHYTVSSVTGQIQSIQGQPSANCPASNASFSYDSKGLITSKTDALGNVTTYTYNDRGLETSRTEASGTPQARTTSTEWDPVRFLPIRIQTPNRITTYVYDAKGQELNRKIQSL